MLIVMLLSSAMSSLTKRQLTTIQTQPYTELVNKKLKWKVELLQAMRDRNRRPEGEWMGADQNFFRNRFVGLYPKISANPQPKGQENSYGLAISQQHTLGNSAEAKREKLPKQQHYWVRPVWPLEQTSQAGNWIYRPVRPVTQTGRSQTARNQNFKLQISSKQSLNPTKLGGYLHTCPVNISPRDLSQNIKGSWEFGGRSKWIGVFSRTQKNSNSWELTIPGGLALG